MMVANPKFSTIDFSKLKAALTGAAPMTKSSFEALEDIVGKKRISDVFGMTETGHLPEESARALREIDGEKYMFSGDVGYMDEDGFIFLCDRAKDMLNVGGYKVFSLTTSRITKMNCGTTLSLIAARLWPLIKSLR